MVKKKKEFVFGLFVLIFLLGVVNAASLGVSPPKHEINFQPGFEGSYSFNFRSGDPSLEYIVYAEGDLKDYVSLSTNTFVGSSKVDVYLTLPNSLEVPGRHRIFIRAEQVPTDPRGTLGGVPSVRGAIDVFVPYPGRYAELEFDVYDVNIGEKADYYLKISSKGDEILSTISEIKIVDSQNKTVKVFDLGNDEILPTKHIEIISNIDTSTFNAGTYKAVAKVSYEGGEKIIEDEFRVGELLLNIVNHTNLILRDEINPFFIEVESSWNDNIENVYAEVSIVGGGNYFQTPSINLGSFETKRLEGYFDTSGIEADNLQLDIKLMYQGQVTEKIVSVSIKDGSFEINYLIVGAIVVIWVLVIVLVWIVFRLRRLEKDNVKKKK